MSKLETKFVTPKEDLLEAVQYKRVDEEKKKKKEPSFLEKLKEFTNNKISKGQRGTLLLSTKKGRKTVNFNDFIIKDENGDLSVVSSEEFEKNYDEVEIKDSEE